MLMQSLIQQESQGNILDLGCSVLLHKSELVPSDFQLFLFQQNAQNDKKFSQEDQMKIFVENILSLRPAVFYLSGINKVLDKWQKVIENFGKYTIDWD